MTADDMENLDTLLKQISLGEDSTFELKDIKYKNNNVYSPDRDSMSDTMAAMANSYGGVIVFGVDDKTHEITGLPLDKLEVTESWIKNIANDLIRPPLQLRLKKISAIIQGKEKYIIRVDIPRSLFVHESQDGYFQRIGSSKRKMQPDVLARLFQQRSQTRLIRFDEQLVMTAKIEDLVPKYYDRFKSPLSSANDIEFLEKIKFISRDEENELFPTVCGILMAAEEPEKYISNAFIQAVCYHGNDYTDKQLDAQDITGPLDMQIKEACKFVQRNMKVRAVKNQGRIETPQYSLNAVFEAIVNAVAHRDYSIYGSKIRLHIFSDRLELYSPGNIPNTMTIDSLSLRQSSRNELITSVLARCKMNFDATNSKRKFIMDKRGEGVPIIISESTELSGIKPEYKLIDDTELLLIIYAA